MKRLRMIVLVLATFAVVSVVHAVWNASKQQIFVERLSNLMYQFQDSREECKRLVDMWFGESISSDPAFVNHSSGIDTTEMTAVITYCQDFANFNENAAVGTADRKQTIVPFIGTRVRQ